MLNKKKSYSIKWGALEFFDSILNLRAMPSTDNRYKDAKGDFTQHYINNNDWTLEEILLDRYDFTNSDKNFFKLLNLVVSPTALLHKDLKLKLL